ncbi:MAG: hypothetical protein HOG03_15480 [Desulfobacula sp.]|uniref:hypothetical protein n=1 Tax=Desulfobacula sp. TaxID=2593537 RepID=UPI001D983AF1|nr:hypothetical protein [Desulfobacula sp.]MBT3486863.1 hypothetical protein [Desulfobacula sp.]MBT3805983.1 hypothetical protein [Desulfobacula sp.]MBT4026890.1 hypothetical protein [Desulfobacula sp.]MBT4200799.1 hypothetical protein [Desulfobacula sp.]
MKIQINCLHLVVGENDSLLNYIWTKTTQIHHQIFVCLPGRRCALSLAISKVPDARRQGVTSEA